STVIRIVEAFFRLGQIDRNDDVDEAFEAALMLRKRPPQFLGSRLEAERFLENVTLWVLLLRVRLVERRQRQNYRARRPRASDLFKMAMHILLGVVHRLDRDEHEMGRFSETFQILRGIVARLIEAAGIEEFQKRSLGGGKVVTAGEARAGPVAVADLRFARAG